LHTWKPEWLCEALNDHSVAVGPDRTDSACLMVRESTGQAAQELDVQCKLTLPIIVTTRQSDDLDRSYITQSVPDGVPQPAVGL
jgi:hypothetical protein